ncbi:uncharacterized protein AMSG_12359 [Thecamonas trahens ATCC 50062]|uniref:EF-hand domain-containing protein n=1 Tax=Thecamonas trahens ATCC 50062 TaxID=461836 RepID=A0A0L0DRC5_THETB|nr:hypothetical protein AMSG_12359 [Thecamonas trahens ATCC 50062]KNC54869.1 hypothetical protein AMSG_12359 [Thecamonas trahens ATCC 50062]|eukprot:XP_013753523.1 hypothetical protein AMSG_12359 [Thecamonas trahens ATCC 50062]
MTVIDVTAVDDADGWRGGRWREQIKLAFDKYDKTEEGVIKPEDVPVVLRSLGYNPSEKDVKEILASLRLTEENMVVFVEFLNAAAPKMVAPDAEELILEAWRLFDAQGNGFITSAQLFHIMTNLGEKLTQAEVDELIREADPGATGAIDYEAFSKIMLETQGNGHIFIDRTAVQSAFYKWHSSRAWRYFIFAIIVAHMSLARWEPTSHRAPLGEHGKTYAALEILACTFYLIDIGLKFPSMGGLQYFKSLHTGSYLFTAITILIDAFITYGAGTNVRFSRPFRAALLVASSAQLRDIVGTMLKAIPKLAEISVAYLALVLTYGIMGMNLYHSYYTSDGLGDFNSFSASCLAMFVLSTSENYPDIMRPAYDRNNVNVIFFVSYIIFSMFLLMNVVVAIVLEGYKAIREKKVSRDFIEETKALDVAFALLDVNNNGLVTFDEWRDFLDAVAPGKYDQEQALILFHHLDQHHSGQGISRSDWDGLVDALLLRFSRRREAESLVPACVTHAFSGASTKLRKWRDQTKSRYVKAVVFMVVAANITVLGLVGSLDDPSSISAMYAFNLAFLVFYGLEHGVQMLVLGFAKFWESRWNRVDLIIFLSQVSTTIALFTIAPRKAFGFPNSERNVRVLQGLFALRALRLVSLFERLRKVVSAMMEVLPTMGAVFFLILTVFYVFSIIGLELFAGSGTGQFPNFVESQLTLFQLLTGSNWHEVMYEEIKATSSYTAWYFVAFIVLVVVVFLNVLVAIVVDVFVQQMDLLEGSASGAFLNVMETVDGRWRVWKSNTRWERELFQQARQVTTQNHIELRDDADLFELGILGRDRAFAPSSASLNQASRADLTLLTVSPQSASRLPPRAPGSSAYSMDSDNTLSSLPSHMAPEPEKVDVTAIANQLGVELESCTAGYSGASSSGSDSGSDSDSNSDSGLGSDSGSTAGAPAPAPAAPKSGAVSDYGPIPDVILVSTPGSGEGASTGSTSGTMVNSAVPEDCEPLPRSMSHADSSSDEVVIDEGK